MKGTHVKFGKNLLLKGVPVIFNKKGALLHIGDNCTIKSSFLSNYKSLQCHNASIGECNCSYFLARLPFVYNS